ncbi:MAG: SPOR domain-containing protein, partial [Bacteroidales bacterium]|nr:SPOR domain-containing protein [Bacteroidales bacterium]
MVEDVKMFSPLVPRQLQEPEPLFAVTPEVSEEPIDRSEPPMMVSAETAPLKRPLAAATFPAIVDTPIAVPQSSPSAAKPYTIQILALKKRQHANDRYLAGLDSTKIKTYKGKDGYLRYVIGYFDDQSSAETYLKSLKSNDRFQDAWIRELSLLEKMSY